MGAGETTFRVLSQVTAPRTESVCSELVVQEVSADEVVGYMHCPPTATTAGVFAVPTAECSRCLCPLLGAGFVCQCVLPCTVDVLPCELAPVGRTPALFFSVLCVDIGWLVTYASTQRPLVCCGLSSVCLLGVVCVAWVAWPDAGCAGCGSVQQQASRLVGCDAHSWEALAWHKAT